jgi:hypothetical protein
VLDPTKQAAVLCCIPMEIGLPGTISPFLELVGDDDSRGPRVVEFPEMGGERARGRRRRATSSPVHGLLSKVDARDSSPAVGSSHDQGTVQDCPKRPGRISANFAGPSYHILLEFMIPMTWSRFHFPRRVE